MTRFSVRSAYRLRWSTAIAFSTEPRLASFQYRSRSMVTPANGGTIGFACSSTQQADAWHAAGIANGGTSCEDPPGVREIPTGKFYVAYLRDLDGNKLCALHRMG
jgi:predicted lactoylglutathione lyase